MPRSSSAQGIPLIVLSLAVFAFAGEPEWVEVRSPHFSVVTDTGEKRGREVALRFEQLRIAFGTLLAKARVNLPVPLQIVAFRNTKEFNHYVPLWKGKPIQASGLFEGNDDRSFIMLDMSVDDPWQVVFHEYAHQLLNGNTSAEFQPWFDEGFAEFYSTIKVNGKETDVGLPSQTDLEILHHMAWMKVADLFRVRNNSSIYNESGDHRTMFYAESWLVVHYLFDKMLTPNLETYFDLAVNKGLTAEDAIQQAFGISSTDFDKALRQYFLSDRYAYYKLPAPAGAESDAYTAKPLGSNDAKMVMADMHLHSPDYQDKAATEFEDVLKAQPSNPAALRGLGYAYLLKHDFQQAGEYFARAVEHDSEDPRALYYSALLVQREGRLGRDGGDLAVIQNRLEKSIALNPEFADAYNLLAFVDASQGKADEALKMMSRAATLNPRNAEYSYNLARMYIINHKYDEATALLGPLMRSSDPGVAGQAAQLQVQVDSAKRLANEHSLPQVQTESELHNEAAVRDAPVASLTEPSALRLARSVNEIKGKLRENLDTDKNAIADLEHEASSLTSLLGTTNLNKTDETVARYYRGIAREEMNVVRDRQGLAIDLSAAQEALADFDKVIATGSDIPSWGVVIASVEYFAGGIAANQVRSDSAAFSYWEKCAQQGHAGCLNIVADAHITGEGGEKVDFGQALDIHHRLFQTGVGYNCAGAYSARSIANIAYFTGVRRPGDDELAWVSKSYDLSDRVEASAAKKNACDGSDARIEEFLYRLSRGERRDQLLRQALERLDEESITTKATIEYLSGFRDEKNFEAQVESSKSERSQCSAYFEGMWYAEVTKKHALARKYYQRLLDTGQKHCRLEIVYAEKFKF
jgi:tetratricopeptide (TPR) repeat protein